MTAPFAAANWTNYDWGSNLKSIVRNYPAQAKAPKVAYQVFSSGAPKDPDTCQFPDVWLGPKKIPVTCKDPAPYTFCSYLIRSQWCWKLWPQLKAGISTAASSFVFAPYSNGSTLQINNDVSAQATVDYLFPYTFYTAAQDELKQLLGHVPSTANRYAQVAWCTHVAWCCYSMLLATNVYPLFWRLALEFAKNPNYMPPEKGWAVDFNKATGSIDAWSDGFPLIPFPELEKAKTTDRNVDVTKGSCTLVSHPFFAVFQTARDTYDFNTGLDGVANLLWFQGLVGKMPWAARNAVSPGLKTTEAATNVTTNPALQRLYYCASFFGGLPAITEAFFAMTATDVNKVVQFWSKFGQQLATITYDAFVNGGVAGWLWITDGSLAIDRMAMSNGDLIALRKAYNDAVGTGLKALYLAFAGRTIKRWIQFIQGDYLGSTYGYYRDNRKQMAKDAEKFNETANASPDVSSFMIPPLFIRHFQYERFSTNVLGDYTESFVDDAGVTQNLTGTEGVKIHVMRAWDRLKGLVVAAQPLTPDQLKQLIQNTTHNINATTTAAFANNAPPPKMVLAKPTSTLVTVTKISAGIAAASAIGWWLLRRR